MARSIIQAQAASPTFTHVYAALVAIVNTKVCLSYNCINLFNMAKRGIVVTSANLVLVDSF